MPVQAKHTINTGDYVYNPGEIISELTAEEEQRLIRLGAALRLIAIIKTTRKTLSLWLLVP